MRSRISGICAFILLVTIALMSPAQVRKPTATLKLNGKQYIAFARADVNGILSATDVRTLPIFLIIGQDGASVYGTMITPDTGLLYGDGPVPDKGDTAVLLSAPLRDGSLSGNKLTVNQENANVKGDVVEQLAIVFGKKAKSATLTTSQTDTGAPVDIEFLPCTDKDRVSGMYVGKYWNEISSMPTVNNCIVAFHVNGTTAKCYLRAKSATLSSTWNLTGIYNSKTRTFTMNIFDITYTFTISASGQMNVSSKTPWYTGKGVLYPFNNNATTPVLGKVKPGKLSPGQSGTLVYGVKNVYPGFLVTDDNDGVSITGFRLVSSKSLEVYFSAAEDASGTFTATLTNADGKTATARKKVAIQ